MSVLRQGLGIVGLFALYFATAKWGLTMDAVSGFATLVWPPSGIALAALLIFGPRIWPGVTLGAFLVNWMAGAPLAVAAGIGIGNTLEPLAGYWLLQRVHFRNGIDRVRDALALVFLAALGSTMVSASIGVTCLWLGGKVDGEAFLPTCIAWWIGDALGVMVVAPMVLVWSAARWPKFSGRGALESTTLAATIAAVGLAVFQSKRGPVEGGYLLFPPLIWAALRFGPRGAVSAVFAASAAAIWGTVRGGGPFTTGELSESLLHLQLFMGVVATSTMILATVVAERAESARALVAAESHIRESEKLTALGRMAGGVAHEFNNLLQVIIGYGNLIKEPWSPDEPVQGHATEVVRAAERAADLTRQLLAFGRKQVISPRTIDLNALVLNLEDMLRRLIGESIVLETKLAPELICVRVDPGQMQQVLMNLIINARDAMPRGGRLTVATSNAALDTEEGPAARRCAVLAVTDTGVGMDDETRARVFEPFFTTKEIGKGTGLGLASAYGIVEQSGGHITVESEPGRGATFTVFLPWIDAPLEPLPTPGTVARAPGGTETVLVVEDEEAVRRQVCRSLRTAGYRVIEAATAEDAEVLATNEAGRIAVLLTDVVMSGLRGDELAGRLRTTWPDLRVVYMSGYSGDLMSQPDGPSAGTAFMQKPFTPSDLLRKVREVLS